MLVYLLFIIGFVLIIKSADILVDGASSIAKKLKISSIVIGLTIVSFGTSMPELVVNIISSLNGNTDIAIGNILGSNIANILLILGISAFIYPLTTKRNTVLKEIPLALGAAIAIAIATNDIWLDGTTTSVITKSEGLLFLMFFIIFLYYTFSISKDTKNDDQNNVKIFSTWISVLMILGGLVGLVIGGKWVVDGAISLARIFGLSESFIGLTIIAIGTSLPELATSAIAAYKKQCDIAIGNVVGSNIFNIFWIIGISAVINPLPFQAINHTDILMTILASALLFITMFIGKKHVLERWQGAFFVLIYIGYIGWLVSIQ